MDKEQIIKALECCAKAKDVYCKDCAYQVYGGLQCQVQAVRDTLSLIKELEFEKRMLEAQNRNYRQFCDDAGKVRDRIKADTVRKMKERLAQAICDNTYPDFNKDGKPVNIWKATTGYDALDQITKEMLEGENEN